MVSNKKSTLTFTIPAYLHDEINCRAQSAKRCMTGELIAQLEGSLLAQTRVISFSEVTKLKLLMQSKDFSRRSSISIPANLHQKLKIASVTAGRSMSVELASRVQESYRWQGQIDCHTVAALEVF